MANNDNQDQNVWKRRMQRDVQKYYDNLHRNGDIDNRVIVSERKTKEDS